MLGSSTTVTDTLLINNIAEISDGGAAKGSGVSFYNCTIMHNSAPNGDGGVLEGGGLLEDCVLIGNDAANGGATFATTPTKLTRCLIASGGASQKGAAVYSASAGTEVRDSLVRGFAADASGGATTLVYVDGASAVLDRVTWSDNKLDAVESTDDATVVVRNNDGLNTTDGQAAALLGCGDEAITEYCFTGYCTDVATGITCYCFPDTAKTDPDLGACESSGEMSSLVLGAEGTQLLLLKKDNGNATTSLFFPNTGDVFISWGLAVTENAERLNWTASLTDGELEAGGVQKIMLALDMSNLQARKTEYSTELTLNVSSPIPTPSPISSSTTVVVRALLSALANAAASFANITTNLAQLAAGDSVDFIVTPVDATGMTILDPTDFAYFGMLTHVVSNTSVMCRVGYDSVSNMQEGGCDIPSAVCTFDVGSTECDMLPPVGAFTLEVTDAQGAVVGSTHSSFTVAHCPATFYESDGKCALCPRHVECAAGSSISDWKLDAGYYRTDDESDDVRECRFGTRSCPGAGLNNRALSNSSLGPYCAPEFIGPLCSQCAAEHFLSWEGSGDCHKCAAGKSHSPTIGLVIGVIILCGLFAACVSKKCKGRKTDTPPSAFSVVVEKLYVLSEVKFFVLFLAFQAHTRKHTLLLTAMIHSLTK